MRAFNALAILMITSTVAVSQTLPAPQAVTDPKQIADPLSEALAVVATQVKELKDKVKNLEGNGNVDHDGVHSLQAVIEIDYQI